MGPEPIFVCKQTHLNLKKLFVPPRGRRKGDIMKKKISLLIAMIMALALFTVAFAGISVSAATVERAQTVATDTDVVAKVYASDTDDRTAALQTTPIAEITLAELTANADGGLVDRNSNSSNNTKNVTWNPAMEGKYIWVEFEKLVINYTYYSGNGHGISIYVAKDKTTYVNGNGAVLNFTGQNYGGRAMSCESPTSADTDKGKVVISNLNLTSKTWDACLQMYYADVELVDVNFSSDGKDANNTRHSGVVNNQGGSLKIDSNSSISAGTAISRGPNSGLTVTINGATITGDIAAGSSNAVTNIVGGTINGKMTVKGKVYVKGGTVTGLSTVESGGLLEVQDGKIEVNGDCVTVKSGGTLTVKGGKVYSTTTSNVVNNYGTANVESGFVGSMKADGTLLNNLRSFKLYGGSTTNIKGGEIQGGTNAIQYDNSASTTNTYVNITGGTVTGNVALAKNCVTKISGGTIKGTVTDAYEANNVASGYTAATVILEAGTINGTLEVKCSKLEIGDPSITSTRTITINSDSSSNAIDISGATTVNVNNGVTLTAPNRTIRLNNSAAKAYVKTGATVTATHNGDNDCRGAIHVEGGATLYIQGGTVTHDVSSGNGIPILVYSNSYVEMSGGAITAKKNGAAVWLYNGAKVTMTGGTVQHNNGKPAFLVKDGTTTVTVELSEGNVTASTFWQYESNPAPADGIANLTMTGGTINALIEVRNGSNLSITDGNLTDTAKPTVTKGIRVADAGETVVISNAVITNTDGYALDLYRITLATNPDVFAYADALVQAQNTTFKSTNSSAIKVGYKGKLEATNCDIISEKTGAQCPAILMCDINYTSSNDGYVFNGYAHITGGEIKAAGNSGQGVVLVYRGGEFVLTNVNVTSTNNLTQAVSSLDGKGNPNKVVISGGTYTSTNGAISLGNADDIAYVENAEINGYVSVGSGKMELDGCTINSYVNVGSGKMDLDGCTINGNVTVNGSKDFDISNSTVQASSGTVLTVKGGATADAYNTDFLIKDGGEGNGAIIEGGAQFTARDCDFISKGTRDDSYSSFRVNDANSKAETWNGRFESNNSHVGVRVLRDATLIMHNPTVVNTFVGGGNTAAVGDLGGKATVTLDGGTYTTDGGTYGVKFYGNGTVVEINDATITANTTNYTVYVAKGVNITLTNCDVVNTHADGKALTLADAGNTATINGGTYRANGRVVIGVFGANTITLNNPVIYSTGNTSTGYYPLRSDAGRITAGSYVVVLRSPFGLEGITENAGFTVSNAESTIVIDEVTYYVYTGANGGPAVMEKGAAVRISADPTEAGIRFTSYLSKKTVDYIKGIDPNAVFGTAIIPTQYLTGDDFDIEVLKEKYEVLEIPATEGKGLNPLEDANGNVYGYEVRAAIVNIATNHLNWRYSAVAYIKYTENNETVYVYGDFDKEANSRSILEIAYAAYNDLSNVQGGDYVYPADGGMYSPYTEKQRGALKVYADQYYENSIVD